jgi:hypothetical protein
MLIFFAFPSCLFGIILAYDNKTALLSYLRELKTRMVSMAASVLIAVTAACNRKICRTEAGLELWYSVP